MRSEWYLRVALILMALNLVTQVMIIFVTTHLFWDEYFGGVFVTFSGLLALLCAFTASWPLAGVNSIGRPLAAIGLLYLALNVMFLLPPIATGALLELWGYWGNRG